MACNRARNGPANGSCTSGRNKISLQSAGTSPNIAWETIPGSGNFCLVTDVPIEEVVSHLQRQGVAITAGPGERAGAVGPILSVYFRDLDGNLVEVSNQL